MSKKSVGYYEISAGIIKIVCDENYVLSVESNMYIYIPYKIYDNIVNKYVKKISDKKEIVYE